VKRRPLARAFALGFVTGLVYFTGTVYWVTLVMNQYGDLQMWVAVLVNTAMIACLSLWPAAFAVVVRRSVVAFGDRALMAAPFVWVAGELGRTVVPHIGFPWVLLGYSQATVLPVAQLASIFGVYGVSVLVAAVNASLAIVVTGSRGGRSNAARFGPLVVVASIVAAVAVWGARRVARSEWTNAGDPIRVGLVQGNVDQSIKWDRARSTAIFEEHLRLTQRALDAGAELVIWPESSTPFMLEENPLGAEQIRAVARHAHVPILLGSDQVEWRNVDSRRVPSKIFNAAFLVSPDGTTGGVYRKMHLVPFGEYVPLKELLFFAAPLTQAVGEFSPGETASVLPVAGHRISTAICYEIIYSELVRRFVVNGSELLTTITNDAWFGATSAPYQHFEQASMRAIENGRYLVRSANTGISGIVDPYGRVLQKTDIYEQAVVSGTARFLQTTTFYTRHGDIVAYAGVIVTLALLLVPRRPVLR